MIAALIDHLWQSTLFALGAGMMTLALKANGARFRYALWLAASLKFLIPFAVIATAGGWIASRPHPLSAAPAGLQMVRQVVEPFASAQPSMAPTIAAQAAATGHAAFHVPMLAILLAVWALGTAAVLILWALRWGRMHAILRGSSPFDGLGARARRSPATRHDITLPDIILGADFFRAHRVLISESRRMVYFVYNGAPIFR